MKRKEMYMLCIEDLVCVSGWCVLGKGIVSKPKKVYQAARWLFDLKGQKGAAHLGIKVAGYGEPNNLDVACHSGHA